MAILPQRPTALDIELEASVGTFRVGSNLNGHKSLEVKFFLTHVGLNFSAPSNDKLLTQLAPVREIFDFKDLDFDQIMQRDIDDARVSADLVPYLLDEQSKDMVKFFPPIVIVVMPIQEGRKLPEAFYPKVTTEEVPPDSNHPYARRITRSGTIGQEVFQFEQPIADGQAVSHDAVRLRLNSHRTRLVIVDGQHRAMALLAIYRNLKDQWSDEKRAPFKDYYSIWTPNFINRFNLEEISLPIILCTIPELDAVYAEENNEFNMLKAARSIFLTLNKTARPVSDSRNKLLDDNDLISYLMRRTLSDIKKKDAHRQYAMQISNVELDQDGSKQKILAPVAITGVPHIYYMIEHMMLDNGSAVQGVRPRAGMFSMRNKVADLLERLDGRNVLGAATADTIRRDLFTEAAAAALGEKFDAEYGKFVIGAFEKFAPFDRHNRAVIEIYQQLQRERYDQLKPILFEGQGIGRVFEAHRANLRQKLRNGDFNTDVPEIEAISRHLDATADRIANTVERLRYERAEMLFSDLSSKKIVRGEDGKLNPKAVDWSNRLYEGIYTTVAFQAALVCGFLGLIEKAERRLTRGDFLGEAAIDRAQAFDEYIEQLNKFFIPQTSSHIKRLVRVFSGELADDENIWTAFRPSNQTFRSVVYRAEMQPDQWPKYRYLLLEIWTPSHPALKAIVDTEKEECRSEVFAALHDFYKVTYCRENQKLDADLTTGEKATIFSQAFDPYNALLRNIKAAPLNRARMNEAVATVQAAAATEPEDSSEGESTETTDT